MSNETLKTPEEILDTAITEHAAKMLLEDSIYRRSHNGITYVMVNKSVALAAVQTYADQVTGEADLAAIVTKAREMKDGQLKYSVEYIVNKYAKYITGPVLCPACDGNGFTKNMPKHDDPDYREEDCEVCNATGKIESPLPSTKGEDELIKDVRELINDILHLTIDKYTATHTQNNIQGIINRFATKHPTI